MLPTLTSRLFSYPKSDHNRIILPLNHINGTYAEDRITFRQIGGRCTPQDVYTLLDTIYRETSNLLLLRICFKVKSMFLTLMLVSLLLIIYGAATTYYAAAYTGLVIGALVLFIFYFQIKKVRRQVDEELPELHKKINSIFNRFSDRFEGNHLRWEVPTNCLWLELWYSNSQQTNTEIGEVKETLENDPVTVSGMKMLPTKKGSHKQRSKSSYTVLDYVNPVEKTSAHNVSLNTVNTMEDA